MIIRRETWICDQCGKKFSFETSQKDIKVLFSDWKKVEGKGLCCPDCIAKLKATPKETPKYDRFPYPPFAKESAPGIPGRIPPLPPVDSFPPMPPVKPPRKERYQFLCREGDMRLLKIADRDFRLYFEGRFEKVIDSTRRYLITIESL